MSERMTDKRLTAFLRGGASSYGGIEWELLQALQAEREKLRAVAELPGRLVAEISWDNVAPHMRARGFDPEDCTLADVLCSVRKMIRAIADELEALLK